ncbi:HEAT repeat domain-containing protein [Streptomyces mayteni]
MSSGDDGDGGNGIRDDDRAAVERVDRLLGAGFVGDERAAEVVEAEPESAARLVDWLRGFAAAGDWPRFGRFVLLAAFVRPPGLGPVVRGVLERAPEGVNRGDLVEVLREIGDPEAVPVLLRYLDEVWPREAPFHSTGPKIVEALGAIDTADARRALRDIATGDRHPAPLRWYAAVELDIEDELGFDEDEMLGGP